MIRLKKSLKIKDGTFVVFFLQNLLIKSTLSLVIKIYFLITKLFDIINSNH